MNNKQNVPMQKIYLAANRINAIPAADGKGYIYLDDETLRWYRASEDDLLALGNLMHNKRCPDPCTAWRAQHPTACLGSEDDVRALGLID